MKSFEEFLTEKRVTNTSIKQKEKRACADMPALAFDVEDLPKLKEMIDDGCDIDYVDEDGWTALGYAVRYHNIDAVKYLLEEGADPEVDIGSMDTSAIYYCLATPEYENIDYSIMELLLKHGADMNRPNRVGYTPFMVVAKNEKDNSKVYSLLKKYNKTPSDTKSFITQETVWDIAERENNKVFLNHFPRPKGK